MAVLPPVDRPSEPLLEPEFEREDADDEDVVDEADVVVAVPVV